MSKIEKFEDLQKLLNELKEIIEIDNGLIILK